MKIRRWNRVLAMLLAVVMAVNSQSTMALANVIGLRQSGGQQQETSGIGNPETFGDENAVLNTVTFVKMDGAVIKVGDEEIDNEGTAEAKDGTIIFSVFPEEGYEITRVLVDGEEEAEHTVDEEGEENAYEYIIELIQTDETIVSVETQPVEAEKESEAQSGAQTPAETETQAAAEETVTEGAQTEAVTEAETSAPAEQIEMAVQGETVTEGVQTETAAETQIVAEEPVTEGTQTEAEESVTEGAQTEAVTEADTTIPAEQITETEQTETETEMQTVAEEPATESAQTETETQTVAEEPVTESAQTEAVTETETPAPAEQVTEAEQTENETEMQTVAEEPATESAQTVAEEPVTENVQTEGVTEADTTAPAEQITETEQTETETEAVTETAQTEETTEAAQTEEATEAPANQTETDTEAAQTKKVTEAATDVTAAAADGSVTVSAAEGVLPVGTQVGMAAADQDAAMNAISAQLQQEDPEFSLKDVYVADITLKDADGNVIQPNGDVTVTITGLTVPEGATWAAVYHIDEDGAATKMADVAPAETVSFTASHFSTYAVAFGSESAFTTPAQNPAPTAGDMGMDGPSFDGQSIGGSLPGTPITRVPGSEEKSTEASVQDEEETVGNGGSTMSLLPGESTGIMPMSLLSDDEAIATFYFYSEDEELLDTQAVANNGELLEPKAPEKQGYKFMGWSTSGSEPYQTFGRQTVTETRDIKLYPHFEEAHYVFFMDGENRVFQTKEGVENDWITTTDVNLPMDSEHGLIGWYYKGGDKNSLVGNRIQLGKENVFLEPSIQEGHWITFVTGEGASYVEPAFYLPNARTVQPENPKKQGYTFAGWQIENGRDYQFGQLLAENITLNAKWNPGTAQYTVVYWVENANYGNLYLAEEDRDVNQYSYLYTDPVKKTGTTDGWTNVNATLRFLSKDATSRIPDYDSDCFEIKPIEQQTIKADGSTIVNVYINRKAFKVTWKNAGTSKEPTCGEEEHIHIDTRPKKWGRVEDAEGYQGQTFGCYSPKQNYGWRWYWNVVCGQKEHTHDSSCYSNDLVVEAKYGADIASTWPGGNWKVKDGEYQAYLETVPSAGREYTSKSDKYGSSTAYYYVEVIPGEGSEGTETFKNVKYKEHHKDIIDGTDWSITKEDHYDLAGFTFLKYKDGDKKEHTDSGGTYNGAKFYYTRNHYKIDFINSIDNSTITTLDYAYEEQLNRKQLPAIPDAPKTVDGVKMEFVGWFDNPDGTGNPIRELSGSMPARNLTYYAVWKIPTFEANVHVSLNGAEGTIVGTFTISYGGSVDANAKIFENWSKEALVKKLYGESEDPEAYTWYGWMVKKNGALVPFNFDTPITEDIDLYPVLSKTGPFKVTYNPNEGSGKVTDDKKYRGGSYADVQGAENLIPPSEDKVFLGWGTDESGKIRYQPQDKLRMENDVTLYAIWGPKPRKTSVTYHENFEGSDETVVDGPLPNNGRYRVQSYDGTGLPKHEGYEFLGWATTPGGNVKYKGDEKIRVNDFEEKSQNHLYARWKAKTGNLKVTKIVEGAENVKRKFEVIVNGEAVPKGQETHNITDNESFVIENLPVGMYSVAEKPVAGYTTTYSVNNNGSIIVEAGKTTEVTITNTYTGDPTGELTGTKVWKDTDPDKKHDNKKEIPLVLFRSVNGGEEETVPAGECTLSWEGDTFIFNGLKRYDSEGKEYTYTVTEKTGAENKVTINGTEYLMIQEGNTITNIDQTPKYDVTKALTSKVPTNEEGKEVGFGADDVVEFSIKVENTGNVTLHDVVVVETLGTFQAQAGVTLSEDRKTATVTEIPVGGSVTLKATYKVTQEDIDEQKKLQNIVTSEGASDVPPVDIPTEKENKAYEVTKTLTSKVPTNEKGDEIGFGANTTVDFSVTVENTGNVTLYDVDVVETLGTFKAQDGVTLSTDGKTATIGEIKVGETVTLTATYTVTQDDIDEQKELQNIVTSSGDPDIPPVPIPTEEKDEKYEVTKSLASKVPTDEEGNEVGFGADAVVEFSVKVENTGNATLHGVVVNETMEGATFSAGAGYTVSEDGKTATVTEIPVGESVTLTATYTVTQDDIDNEVKLQNTVTSDGDPDIPPVPIPTEGKKEAYDVTKALASEVPTDEKGNEVGFGAGAVVEFSVEVKNTGNATLHNVVVNETMEGATFSEDAGYTVSGDGKTATVTEIPVGQSVTLKATYTVTQDDIDNETELQNTVTSDGDPEIQPVEIPTEEKNEAYDVTKKLTSEVPKDKEGNEIGFGAGVVVEFAVKVENTGNATLHNVVVNETMEGATFSAGTGYTVSEDGKTATVTEIPVGQSVTLTATYTVTQDDIDNETKLQNTVTSDGDPDIPSVDIPTEEKKPGLTSKKTLTNSGSGKAGAFKVGETATFDITVTNSGNTTQKNVTVTEQLAGATIVAGKGYTINKNGQAVIAEMAPGATVTVKAKYTVKQADIDNESPLTNIAKVEGDNGTGPDPTPGTDIPEDDRNPKLKVHKTIVGGTNSGFRAGDEVKFHLYVENTGNVTLYDVKLTDELPGAYFLESAFNAEWPPVIEKLAPGEKSRTFTAYHIVTQEEVDNGGFINTAKAAGYDHKEHEDEEPSVNGQYAVAVYPDMHPALDVVKAASNPAVGSNEYQAGDTVDFTIRVTNTGNVTLTEITVNEQSDAGIVPGEGYTVNGAGQAVIAEMAPGDVVTVHAQHALTQDEINAGTYKNEVTFTAKPPKGPEKTGEAETEIEIKKFPSLTAAKVLTNAGTGESGAFKVGETAEFDITVTNTGNTTQRNVTVTEQLAGATIVAGDEYMINAAGQAMIAELAPGETVVVTAQYTVTQADIDSGAELRNIAAVRGNNGEEPDPEPGTDIPKDSQEPKLSVVKRVIGANYGYDLGNEITYTVVVTNTGNVTLHDVVVTDPLTGNKWLVEGEFEPGETKRFTTKPYTVTEADIKGDEETGKPARTVTNTAEATGAAPNGEKVSAEANLNVETAKERLALEAAKTLTNKGSGENGAFKAGETAEFAITVKNTGNTTRTDVTVTDTMAGAKIVAGDGYTVNEDGTAVITKIAPGGTVTVKAEYTVTQVDIDNQTKLENTAVVGGAGTTTEPDPEPIPTEGRKPALKVTKQVLGSNYGYQLGDKVRYHVIVENTGNVTLTEVMMMDIMTGSQWTDISGVKLSDLSVSLAPGEKESRYTEYTVTEDDILAGRFTNTAAADGRTPDGTIVKDEDSADAGTAAPNGHLTITKTTTSTPKEGNVYKLGETIAYSITAKNDGNLTLTDITVTDELTDDSWRIESLAPGAEQVFTAEYVVTEDDLRAGSVKNVATATGTSPDPEKPEVPVEPGEREDPTETPNPSLFVDKTVTSKPADGNTYALGETITYSITVTNNGNVTISDISVEDQKAGITGGNIKHIDSLAPGASQTFTAEYTVTEDDILRKNVVNVATAAGTDPEKKQVTGSDTVTVPTDEADPRLSVEKRISGLSNSGYKLGDTITYNIYVKNTGNLTINNIWVTDILKLTDGHKREILGGVVSLAPGASETFTMEHVVTEADILKGELENVANASGKASNGESVEAQDSVWAYPEAPNGHLTVAKTTTSTPANGTTYALGETIRYQITATNDGNLTLTDITVTDGLTGDSWTIGSLAPGATSEAFTAEHVVTEKDILAGGVVNVATATGTSPDPKKPHVPVEPGEKEDPTEPKNSHLTITKATTSTPANGKTYALGETITYSITVTNDGNLTITGIDVYDTRTYDAWPIESLAPGASQTFAAKHVVTEADIVAGSVTNVATARGKSPDPQNPNVGPEQAEVTVITDAQNPNLNVRKTLYNHSGNSGYKLGDKAEFHIVVENTGNLTIDNLAVTDALRNWSSESEWTDEFKAIRWYNESDVPVNVQKSLKPGERIDLYTSHDVTEADILAGRITNTARAEGTASNGKPVLGQSTAQAIPVGPNGNLTIAKITTSEPANGMSYALGETITYEITATNDGNLTLTDITVTDELTGNVGENAWTIASLAPGASETFTAEYVVTEADILAGGVKNVATATGTSPDPEKPEVPVDPGDTEDPTEPKNGHLTVTKTTTSTPKNGTSYALGEMIRYQITATNDGNLTLTGITVTDELTGNTGENAWTVESLAPGESRIFTAEYTVTEADILTGSVLNVATAEGTSPDPDEPEVPTKPGEKEDPTETPRPSLFVEKNVTGTPADGKAYVLGETVAYEIKVTNNGNVTISEIAVTDELTGNTGEDAWTIESLAPGASETITTQYVVTETDILAGSVANTAAAAGQAPDGKEVTGDDRAMADTEPRNGHVTITKTTTSEPANGETYALGETITYEITATNDGNLTLTGITVTDELTGNTGENAWTIESLAPGASQTFTAEYVVTEADILAGGVVNVATAEGTSPDPDKPDVPVEPGEKEDPTEPKDGHLTVTKTTTSEPANGETYALGETITYEITATNDGNLTLTDITVTDELTGNTGENAWTIESLEPGASKNFTATYTVTEADILAGSVKNVATATGTSPDPDKPDVPVEPGEKEDPTEPKDGHLTIAKTTTSEPANGETYALGETIIYSITATNDGNLTLTNVVVTDELTDDTWTIDSLEPGASKNFTAAYTVTEADILAGSVVNVATATGTSPDPDKPDVPVTPGEKEDPTEPKDGHLTVTKTTTSEPANGETYALGETITYEITATNDGNLTLTDITVTDELTGNTGENAWTIASLAPGASQTFTATYTVTEADILAGSVVNEATAAGTSPDPEKPEVPVEPGEKEDPTEPKDGHLTVTKTTTSEPTNGTAYALGETITYEITATNDGNLTLTGITVTDELTGNTGENAWTIESLEPGASETFMAEYVVTEADILAGGVVNEATATGTSPDPDKPEVPVNPGETEDPTDPKNGNLTVTKTTTSEPENGTAYELGETITYEITATNDGNLTLTDITVLDELTGNTGENAWTIESLAPGASQTFTAEYVVTEADILAGSVLNVATAEGTSPDPDEPEVPTKPGEKEDPTETPGPSLFVDKEVTGTPADGKAYVLGETVTYEIKVTNNGNVTISEIAVTDELTGNTGENAWTIESLAPGASETFTTQYVVTEADILAGSVVNTAAAAGQAPDGEEVTDDDEAAADTESRNGHVTITKTTTSTPANGTAYALGETITYQIMATNDGNLTLTGITVTDELTGNTGENAWTIASLAPGASQTFTAEYVVTEADILAGGVVNVATAMGTSPDPEKPEVPVVPGEKEDPTEPKSGHVTVTKTTTSTPANGTAYALGETITYQITATNDGNLTLTNVVVTDELTGNTGENAWTIESLAPGASQTFTATYTVTEADILAGGVVNVATAAGTSPDPERPEVPVVPGEKDDPTEPQRGHVTVAKTVTGTPANGVAYIVGETITYQITATNDGNLTLTNVVVTDELTGNTGENAWTIASLAPGASQTFTAVYTVTAADAAAGSVQNVATAAATFPNSPADPENPNVPEVPVTPGQIEVPVDPGTGTVTVTKSNADALNGEVIALPNAQFRVALFSDATLTQQVGAAQTISFGENQAAASATFSGLNSGVYYVAEVDETGAVITAGEYDGGQFTPDYAGGQQVTVAEIGGTAQLSFTNSFLILPAEYYRNAVLTITKQVRDASGKSMNSDETFYAGIFADPEYTVLADNVVNPIVALSMGGRSSVSEPVEVTVPNDGESTVYVTEVTADGTPVENSASFAYDVTTENAAVTLVQDASAETVIVNTAQEEMETSSETSSEAGDENEEETGDIIEGENSAAGANSGGESGEGSGISRNTTSVKTGDETPVMFYLTLLLAAALVLILAFFFRRKRSRE